MNSAALDCDWNLSKGFIIPRFNTKLNSILAPTDGIKRFITLLWFNNLFKKYDAITMDKGMKIKLVFIPKAKKDIPYTINNKVALITNCKILIKI